MQRMISHAGVALLLIGALSRGVLAQPAATDEPSEIIYELDTFFVDPSKDRGYQATTSMSGSRLNEEIRHVPLSISVVTPELMADLDPTSYTDALLFSSSFNPETGTIRGLTAFANNRNSSGIDGQLDTTGIDRIEVVKGPATLMYGVTAAGGQVNAIAKRASVSDSSYAADVQAGSQDRFRARADINQVIIKNVLAARVNLKYETYGDPRVDTSASETSYFQITSQYRPFKNTRINFEIEANRPEQSLSLVDNRWASGLNMLEVKPAGYPNSEIPVAEIYGAPEDWDPYHGTALRKEDHTIYRLDWEQNWIDGLNSLFSFNYQNRPRIEDSLNTSFTNKDVDNDGKTDRVYRTNWRESDYEIDSWTWEAMLNYKKQIGRWGHSALLRWQYRQYDDRRITTRSRTSSDTYTRLSDVRDWATNHTPKPANLVYDEIFKNSGIWDNTSDLKQYSASYMPSYETDLGTFRVSFGAIYSRQLKTDGRPFTAANWVLKDPLPVSAVEPAGGERTILATDLQEGTTTLAGVSYTVPDEYLTFYSVLTGSFRPTSRRNSFGELLPPRRGETTEVGVKFDKFLDGRLSGTVSFFSTDEYDTDRNDLNVPNRNSEGYFLVGGKEVTVDAAGKDIPIYQYDTATNSYRLVDRFTVQTAYEAPVATGNVTVSPGTYDLFFNPNGPKGDYRAVGRYRSEGWDSELFIRVVKNSQMVLSYTYIDAGTVYDPDYTQIGRVNAGTAKHNLGVFGKYWFEEGLLSGLELFGGYRWSTDKVDSYIVSNGTVVGYDRPGDRSLSLGGRYRFEIGKVGCEIQLNVDNITAQDRALGYQSTLTRDRYYYDNDMTWKLMASVIF